MSDMLARITDLSPEKRNLLERLLREKGLDLSRAIIVPQSRDTNTFPLSFAQQRLWFLDQFEPGSPLYNIPTAVRLTGRLDVAALKKSIDQIVRRHEVLRTTFASQNSQPVQVIAPELSLPLPLVDLRDLPRAQRENEVLRLATGEAQQPFDLSQGPFLRTTLLRLDEREHIALLTMHHIAADAWSMGILTRELAALYQAFSTGKPSPLPDLPIQYADFAHWQRRWLQGEVLETQLSYWKQQLGKDSPILNLLTDRPRPAVQTNRGAHQAFALPNHLFKALKTWSQQEQVTLFMTLLAAFQTLLYRYTGHQDISIGSPIANRNRGEIEGLIGFFVNTLVLRADLSGDPTFKELAARVRRVTLGAYAHQDLPFEMLVDKLQPRRDMSHTPLFQVMFALQNAPTRAYQLPDLTWSPLPIHSGTAKFDLTLTMVEETNRLSGVLEYNTDLFDATTIRRIQKHFQTLLESIVVDPERPISTLPLLTRAERRQQLVDWNDTATAYPRDQCLHKLFEAQVDRTPNALAIVFENEQLTYAALNRRANQLAHYLQKLGVRPETLIGLCVDRSLDMIVGLLGILKAGGAYLPLDPAYPPERLAFMLRDARTPLLLTRQPLIAALPLQGCQRVCLDADWPAIARECDRNPDAGIEPENLAYLIYTSGSTGRPKGVMIQHRSALNLATALHRIIYAPHPGAPFRISLNAPLSFDASVQQLVMLLYGHTLYLIPQEIRQDRDALLAYLRHNRIDLLDCVPSQLKLLLAAGLLDGTAWRPSMILPGGEAIDDLTWQRLATSPRIDFYNMYGPTECAVDSTIGRIRMTPTRPNIGRPVANAQAYVLDRHLEPVALGVPGELHIGGAGVGRGYLRRPGLTAERFVPHPFSSEPGARLYKTGDLVRYLPDGNVEFLGRIDHQVKIRGFRIELGEIEAVLKEHPILKEVVVLAREDIPGDKRLVAYLVPENESTPGIGELRSFLKEKLPDYMLPSAFVSLKALPLTPNGKVNRRALPAPDRSRKQLADEYVAPRNPLEEMLAGIWSQVLGVKQISVHDNFFELGGHSLLATQLVSRLRDALQVELPLRNLFESPTVAGLAASVQAARQSAQGLSVPPIEPVPRAKDLPLSFAQQRLWFIDQIEPGTPLYNISSAVRLVGRIDVKALELCLNEIVQRHQVLRTTFPAVDGKAIQRIAPEPHIPLPLVDLSGLPEARREAEALQLASQQAQQSFDLVRGPLLKATLLRLSRTEHIALLTMHHIVSDGWSTGVLIREMAALYRAFSVKQPSPLPDLPIQYADFAAWQRRWLQGQVLEDQMAYWRHQLEGLPPLLELPTDRPRPAVQTFRGAIQRFKLPQNLSSSLKELSQQHGVTLFMTLLAAFQTLLYRYTRQQDISIGTPIANRNRIEIEGLIGFFVNTLVMRTNFSGNPSFRELLDRVREAALGAYAHQDLPFETLVNELQPERNMSQSPLFQVMFVLQNFSPETFELPDLTLTPLEIQGRMAKFDLTLTMIEGPDGLAGSLEYNTDLFDAATVARMPVHFQTLLQAIVADPARPISRLPLLTQAGRHQQLIEWNATTTDYPHDRCIHQLVEAQVERTPDTPALVSQEDQLTYKELNRRANQLAHHLQKLGVGPEVLVGLCVERSLEAIVGLLGVLKAGGAYVPIDPAYPQERISFILEDTQAPVLLTQKHLLAGRQSAFKSGHQSALKSGLTAKPIEIVCLDTDWPLIARQSPQNPAGSATADNLAYVIYTSGSTGRPKGVLLQHRGVCNLATAYIQDFDARPASRILQFFSYCFDGSVADFFTSLLSGATLYIVSQQALLPGPGLARFLRDQAITTAVMPPSALSVLPADDLPALQTLISGGESCTREIVDRWSPGRRFINAYGPTESTVASSWFPVSNLSKEASNIPIGHPLANTQLYILDPHLQPVPVGVPGELHIGGDGLARGYLNRPRVSAEKFIPHPFSQQPGARLYKTGDLARYLPDGNIEFLGRLDHQVKVRGFRIELGEIEALLEAHPSVRKAVALAREDTPGDKRLVAYLVTEEGSSPGVSQLRSFLKQKLPEYMLPSAFVTLQTLPLTPNGKIDRRALPPPDQDRPELEAVFVAPSTPAEEILAAIWAQFLGLDRVGIHDNFFELGGDSILSIQVISRANQAGLQLTPRQLFESPTIAGLAAAAGASPLLKAGASPFLKTEQGIITGPLPLTPIQRWFFEQNLPRPHHWNQAVLLQVQQALDPSLLQKAVEHLLLHHDALRLRFERQASTWRQVNAGLDSSLPFAWIDLSARPQAEQKSALETHTTALQRSLDLAAGPLLRVTYFDLGPHRPDRLLIIVHHMAIDGVSWRILLQDLSLAYDQLRRGTDTGSPNSFGKAVQLPPKTTSFQHWARRLQEYAQTETVRQELPHWLAIAQNGAARLPLDYTGGENSEASARSVSIAFSTQETQALLQEIPATYRTRIDEVLLTALAQAMARWTGSRALLVNLEGHGREDILPDMDLSRTVGWFTTSYPVSLDLEDADRPGEALKAIKEQLRRVPRRGIGYGLLRYLCQDQQIAGQLRTLPQPELSFNYLGQFDQALPEASPFSPAPESRGPDRSLKGNRSHPLEINGGIAGGQLRLEWTYSQNLHRRATIDRLAQNFAGALRAIIAHCQSPDAGGATPSDFPLANLDQKKLDKVLAKMNKTKGKEKK